MPQGVRHIERRARPSTVADEPLAVVNDFPDGVPIARDELDAIETYLGDLVSELLAEKGAKRAIADHEGKPDPQEKFAKDSFQRPLIDQEST